MSQGTPSPAAIGRDRDDLIGSRLVEATVYESELAGGNLPYLAPRRARVRPPEHLVLSGLGDRLPGDLHPSCG